MAARKNASKKKASKKKASKKKASKKKASKKKVSRKKVAKKTATTRKKTAAKSAPANRAADDLASLIRVNLKGGRLSRRPSDRGGNVFEIRMPNQKGSTPVSARAKTAVGAIRKAGGTSRS